MEEITFIEGLEVALVAMSVVFLILVLILICLSFFKYLNKFEKKPVESAKPVKKAKSVNHLDLNDEDMVVACLVATIEASEEYGCELRVVNIREVGTI